MITSQGGRGNVIHWEQGIHESTGKRERMESRWEKEGKDAFLEFKNQKSGSMIFRRGCDQYSMGGS